MKFSQIAVSCMFGALVALSGKLSAQEEWKSTVYLAAADEEEDEDDESGAGDQPRLDELRDWLEKRHRDRGEEVPEPRHEQAFEPDWTPSVSRPPHRHWGSHSHHSRHAKWHRHARRHHYGHGGYRHGHKSHKGRHRHVHGGHGHSVHHAHAVHQKAGHRLHRVHHGKSHWAKQSHGPAHHTGRWHHKAGSVHYHGKLRGKAGRSGYRKTKVYHGRTAQTFQRVARRPGTKPRRH